jgi:hypothetical protein
VSSPEVPHWFEPGDPWLSERMRQVADIAAAELELGPAIEKAFAVFLSAAHARIIGRLPADRIVAAGVPDLNDWPERERTWFAALEQFVRAVLGAIFSKRFRAVFTVTVTITDTSVEGYFQTYKEQIWQRLKLAPELVFDAVRQEITDSVADGDTAQQTHDRVADMLRIDAPGPRGGGSRWFSKIRDLARTVAVSVLNAATFSAAEAYTEATGNRRWQQWWTVEDNRVRSTHRHAHGQSRPVGQNFLVGGFPMRYPGDPLAPPDLTTNCRCSVLSLTPEQGRRAAEAYNANPPSSDGGDPGRVVTAASEPGGGVSMTTETTEAPEPAVVVPEPEAPPVLAAGTLPAEATQARWQGVLAPMGVRSGDNRMIGAPDGPPNVRTLPLPLLYQQATADGHDNSIVVGNITRVWSQDGLLMGEGTFDLGDDQAREVVRKIDDGYHRWVSVRLDNETREYRFYRGDQQISEYELENYADDGSVSAVTVSTDWRLMSATLVAEPAFDAATIALVGDELDDEVDKPDDPSKDEKIAAAATATAEAVPSTEDPEFAAPSAEKRNKAEKSGAAMEGGRYPIENEADLRKAIKAVGRAGGKDGDEAERKKVRKHIMARAKALGKQFFIPRNWNSDGSLKGTAAQLQAAGDTESWYAAVADAVPMEPPAAWFADPVLTGPTKITVTDEGRVYGHIAAWASKHAGLPGDVVPPHNPDTAYSKFHRHPVRCADGSRVKTGPLAGKGHADRNDCRLWAVQAHYDNPDYVLADVVVGEDEHGIWASGALRPGVEPWQVMYVDRYSISGDWRGGELLAACLASVPGFHLDADDNVKALAASAAQAGRGVEVAPGVPQVRIEDGQVVALVAAGVVPPEPPRTGTLANVSVALKFDGDPEEYGRKIGAGMYAGMRQAESEAERQRQLASQAAAYAARVHEAEVARLVARVGKVSA